MTEGNLAALDRHEADREAWEASQEPCDDCGDVGCDCAEEMAEYDADHKMRMMKGD